MQLSPNFTYEEAIRSAAALRMGIDNVPDAGLIPNLSAVALMILQPCRDHYDRPIHPSSWYRSQMLNLELKGAENSDHLNGEAVDFEVAGIDNMRLAMWVRDNLKFDQLILEHYQTGVPASGWIHCSYSIQRANRNEVLTILNNGRTFHGLGDGD